MSIRAPPCTQAGPGDAGEMGTGRRESMQVRGAREHGSICMCISALKRNSY